MSRVHEPPVNRCTLSTCASLLVLTSVVCAQEPTPQAKERARFIATDQYTEREVGGWNVHVHRELLGRRAETGTAALTLLETKLRELQPLLPARALAALQKVPIWLGVDDYEKPNAVYHPSAEWLRTHGYNPDKAGAVELPNAAVFIAWSEGQPMMVLHELAHAYHHQVLGHGCAELRERFQQVRASGLYEAVTYGPGGKPQRAYALNNVEEFFAEMSEAFFGRNDFSPFTRDELRAHDLETCALVEQLWNR
jgi:hypothetical protein